MECHGGRYTGIPGRALLDREKPDAGFSDQVGKGRCECTRTCSPEVWFWRILMVMVKDCWGLATEAHGRERDGPEYDCRWVV